MKVKGKSLRNYTDYFRPLPLTSSWSEFYSEFFFRLKSLCLFVRFYSMWVGSKKSCWNNFLMWRYSSSQTNTYLLSCPGNRHGYAVIISELGLPDVTFYVIGPYHLIKSRDVASFCRYVMGYCGIPSEHVGRSYSDRGHAEHTSQKSKSEEFHFGGSSREMHPLRTWGNVYTRCSLHLP